MREAHAHILALGESLSIPSLDKCASVAECLEAVAQEAARAAKAPESVKSRPCWARLHSARVESWAERRWPTIAELDMVTGDVPAVIMSFDHHAAVANTAALEETGMRPGDVVTVEGQVRAAADSPTATGEVCVDEDGRATGLLRERAAYRAWEWYAANSATRREWIVAALQLLANLGFTEVHDLNSTTWLHAELARMERSGELAVSKVRLYPLAEFALGDPAFFRHEHSKWDSDAVKVVGLKVFADGTLNSRTALMLHPYRDPIPDSPRGRAMVTEQQLDDAVRRAELLGLHLAVHAIGDAAVRMVLDSIERAGTRREMEGAGNRHRIEHAEIVDEADVERFAKLGVVCSVQPCHLLADIEVLRSQLPHRLDRVLPLRDLIDAGCTPFGDEGSGGLLWFGSDVPIVRADPGDSVQAAVHRRRLEMPRDAAIGIEQGITEGEAWAAFG